MSKWERVKWSEVIEIKNGRNQKAVEDINGQYPIYGSGGIMGYANDYLCHENTVIIGRKGSINKPIYVSEKFWNVDTAFGLSAKKNRLFPKYLYYFCVTFNFEKLNTTVTIPSLTKSNLLNIEIPLPPLETQKLIAKTLDTASELLAMRKQQLAELDNLIKSTFYDMFGDPVTNEKGWEIVSINDLCSKIIDCPHNTPQYSNVLTGLNCIRSADLQDGYLDLNTTLQVDLDTFNQRNSRHVPSFNDIVFTREGGRLGNSARVPQDMNICLGQRIMLFTVDCNFVTSEFLWASLNTSSLQECINNIAGGGAAPRVNIKDLINIKCFRPHLLLQKQFAEIVTKVEEQRALAKKAIDETQYLFDSLMSEYFA